MAQIKNVAAIDIRHIPQFTGDIWFVDAGMSASGDGTRPEAAFKTITEARDAASAGDAMTVKAGSYTEDVDMNLDGLELWGEINATLSGTLTVSADSCRVEGMLIAPTSAVGVSLGGSLCICENIKVVGTATTAWDINGARNIIRDGIAVGYSVTAFDIANSNVLLSSCIAQGADTSTRGFYFSEAAADSSTLADCISVGNATAGYEFVSGTANTTIIHCSSGSGDGKSIDADDANVWSGFTYDDVLHTTLTLDGSEETKSYNLFEITGIIEIQDIYGEVTTVLSANHTDCHLNAIADGADVDISDPTGLTLNDAPVGSLISKTEPVASMLDYQSSANVFLVESASFKSPKTSFFLGQKEATTSYIRFTHTTTDAPSSGAIHWACHWAPISDDGFLEVV